MSNSEILEQLTTQSGIHLRIRPACPADETSLADFFTHVSPDDLRFRFLSGAETVRHEQLVALTRVDHVRTESFLAFDEAGVLVATAMLACDVAMQTGEIAIVIRSDYKGKGLGWSMLAYVAGRAEAKGLQAIEAIESRQNRAALQVERELGFTIEDYPGDPTLSLVRRRLATGTAARPH